MIMPPLSSSSFSASAVVRQRSCCYSILTRALLPRVLSASSRAIPGRPTARTNAAPPPSSTSVRASLSSTTRPGGGGGGGRGGNNRTSGPSFRRILPRVTPRRVAQSIREEERWGGLRRGGADGGGGVGVGTGRAHADLQRPHAIALFPGDYADDEDDWDDDWRDQVAGDEDVFHEVDEHEREENRRFVEAMKLREEATARQRERWLKNSQPPVRRSELDLRGRAYGRGGRKTASAAVWIEPAGLGEIVVNRRSLVDYFDRQSDREKILEPLVATETCGKFDIQAKVKGGGLSGQAGAIQHGLARALNHYNPDLYRPPLKRLGLLTRDSRMVERKKIGRKKARKSPQWVRR